MKVKIKENDTLIRGVSKIPPRNLFKFNLNNFILSKEVYFDLNRQKNNNIYSKDETTNNVKDCIKKNLISDAKVGTFLSGGVDSTTVTLLAKRYNNNVEAFTTVFLPNEKFKKFNVDFKYAKKINIEIFSTACDVKSLKYLSKTLKLKTIKISSADLTNIPLLLHAGSTKKNIIISSGMGKIEEIDIALSALSYGHNNPNTLDLVKFDILKHQKYYLKNHSYLSKKVTLLQCTTEYPAPIDELNLNIIDSFKERYKISIGYSDHSNDMATPIIATTKNVDVIEVHVTLDNNLPGPDHVCSLNMHEFKKYVKDIRKTELMLGSFKKMPTKSELKNIKSVRKSLVISAVSKKDDKLSCENLTVKRPGTGIPSLEYNKYLGKTLNKNLKENYFLKKNDTKSK